MVRLGNLAVFNSWNHEKISAIAVLKHLDLGLYWLPANTGRRKSDPE